MLCGSCGTKLEENASFCRECGTPAELSAEAPIEAPMPDDAPPPESDLAAPLSTFDEEPMFEPPFYSESPATPPPHYGDPPPPPPPHPSAEIRAGSGKIIIPIISVLILAAVFACLYFFTNILPFGQEKIDLLELIPIVGGRGEAEPEPVDTPSSPAPAPTSPAPAPTSPAPAPASPAPAPASPAPAPASPAPAPASPTPAPASPVPVISSIALQATGGDVRIEGLTEIEFSPESSGNWEILTWDSRGSNPILEVYDMRGISIAQDDDSAGGYDARLSINLEAGVAYKILAGFRDNSSGAYTLTVAPYIGGIPPEPPSQPTGEPLPGTGGEILVDGWTVYTFTPGASGLWVFSTSDSGKSDPSLELFDVMDNWIAFDDDSGGGYDAMLYAFLFAGETYVLHAGFWGSGSGSYTLTVVPGLSIPGEGGVIRVIGPTLFEFRPERTGTWEFRTSNNGISDPSLLVSSFDSLIFAEDDDGNGDLNSFISVSLDENTVYIVHAGFYNNESGSYDLTVSQPNR